MTFPVFQEPEASFDPQSVTLSCSLETAKSGDGAELGNGHAHFTRPSCTGKGCLSASLGTAGAMPAHACSALRREGGYQMPLQGQCRPETKAVLPYTVPAAEEGWGVLV